MGGGGPCVGGGGREARLVAWIVVTETYREHIRYTTHSIEVAWMAVMET